MSDFRKYEYRISHKFMTCDCSHIIAPNTEYLYCFGTLDGIFMQSRYCHSCEPTPKSWWNLRGIGENTKPDFLVDIWNQLVQPGDMVGFISTKSTRKRSRHGLVRIRTRNVKQWVQTKTTTPAMIGEFWTGKQNYYPIVGIEAQDGTNILLRAVRPI